MSPTRPSLSAVTLIVVAAVFVGVASEFTSRERKTFAARLETAKKILAEVPLIDGHNDLPWVIDNHLQNNLDLFKFEDDLKTVEPWASEPHSHTDLPRLKEGMVGAQFWVSFVNCSLEGAQAATEGFKQAKLIQNLIKKYPKDLQFAGSSEDINEIFKNGKIASLIGLEGGHMVDALHTLHDLYGAGARYLGLTHSCSSSWAQSSVDEDNENSTVIGLTDFGKKIIFEMNKLGMIIDLAHVSKQTMKDVLDVTASPVIFSHSSARALCDHNRNVPDDILLRMASNGGVVMVNFYSKFITCSDSATLHDVIDHINHIRDFAGVDNVGIGSDYNGVKKLPEGLEDVSKFPNLFAELLLDPNWTEENLKKLAGLNFLRAFHRIELMKSDENSAAVSSMEIKPIVLYLTIIFTFITGMLQH